MSIQSAQIPRLMTGKTMRVAVKMEKALYEEARKLKIDIHGLFRLTLLNAVETLRSSQNDGDNTNHEHDHNNTKEAFFDAMDGIRDERHNGNGAGLDSKITERVKNAAQSAQGPFPAPHYRKR